MPDTTITLITVTRKECLSLLYLLDQQLITKPFDDGWIDLRNKVLDAYQTKYLSEAIVEM